MFSKDLFTVVGLVVILRYDESPPILSKDLFLANLIAVLKLVFIQLPWATQNSVPYHSVSFHSTLGRYFTIVGCISSLLRFIVVCTRFAWLGKQYLNTKAYRWSPTSSGGKGHDEAQPCLICWIRGGLPLLPCRLKPCQEALRRSVCSRCFPKNGGE